MESELIVNEMGMELAGKFSDRLPVISLIPSENPWTQFLIPLQIMVTVLNPGDLINWEYIRPKLLSNPVRTRYLIISGEAKSLVGAGVEIGPIYKEREIKVIFAGNPHHAGLYAIGLLEKVARVLDRKPT